MHNDNCVCFECRIVRKGNDPLLFHGWHKATSIQEQEILEKINAHKFPVDKYYEEYTKRK